MALLPAEILGFPRTTSALKKFKLSCAEIVSKNDETRRYQKHNETFFS